MKHNVSQEDILRNKTDKNVKDLFFEMATRIHQHIEKVNVFTRAMWIGYIGQLFDHKIVAIFHKRELVAQMTPQEEEL